MSKQTITDNNYNVIGYIERGINRDIAYDRNYNVLGYFQDGNTYDKNWNLIVHGDVLSGLIYR